MRDPGYGVHRFPGNIGNVERHQGSIVQCCCRSGLERGLRTALEGGCRPDGDGDDGDGDDGGHNTGYFFIISVPDPPLSDLPEMAWFVIECKKKKGPALPRLHQRVLLPEVLQVPSRTSGEVR